VLGIDVPTRRRYINDIVYRRLPFVQLNHLECVAPVLDAFNRLIGHDPGQAGFQAIQAITINQAVTHPVSLPGSLVVLQRSREPVGKHLFLVAMGSNGKSGFPKVILAILNIYF
jgi:hypothetical protein